MPYRLVITKVLKQFVAFIIRGVQDPYPAIWCRGSVCQILIHGLDHWSGHQVSCVPTATKLYAVLQGVVTEEGA